MEFEREAAGLVGEVIATVHYVTLDYFAERFRGTAQGPRYIESAAEWDEPTWRHPSCDTVDFAVELATGSGRHFTVSWESPGMKEGIGLRELPAIGTAVDERADAAIWDVTARSGWRDVVGQEVTDVVLHYEEWGEGAARWCSWITMQAERTRVELILGEGRYNVDTGPDPSADNVAVLFSPDTLPDWLVARR